MIIESVSASYRTSGSNRPLFYRDTQPLDGVECYLLQQKVAPSYFACKLLVQRYGDVILLSFALPFFCTPSYHEKILAF